MLSAVVDRIVDEKYLVILVGEEEKEYNFPITDKYRDLREGNWVLVQINENDEIVDMQLDEQKNKDRQATIQNKMALLKARKGSKYKTK